MSSRCDNCGGTLIYDISAQKVKCLHCSSLFEPELYNNNTAAKEYEDSTVFACPNCGAEIASSEFDSVEYCLYCGSFVTLESQMTKVKKPDLIIPFSKSREECKASYKKAIRKKLFAPKEFKDEQFVEGFAGIYIPFWNYNYEYGPEIKIEGENTRRKGDYLVTQHYDSSCNAEGNVDSIVYDASSTFDDEISLQIAPFDKTKLREFNPSYMFGFYGDTADIESENYSAMSAEEVENKIWDKFSHDPNLASTYPGSKKPDTMREDFNIKSKAKLAMLPVWFLTWRKGDRVAYSVMNGESGEMYTEVPVDTRKYLLFSLLLAVPLYLLLNLASMVFTANDILTYSIGFAGLMIMLYVFELDKIVRKVMHTDDLGFLLKHEDIKQKSDEQVTDNIVYELFSLLVDLIKEAGLFSILLAAIVLFCMLEWVIIALVIIMIFVPVYTIFRLKKNTKILGDKKIWFDVLGAMISIVLGAGLLIMDPAKDEYYYIASLVCMLGVGVAAVQMMKRYNQLLTRPVPRFFKEKGGVK